MKEKSKLDPDIEKWKLIKKKNPSVCSDYNRNYKYTTKKNIIL